MGRIRREDVCNVRLPCVTKVDRLRPVTLPATDTLIQPVRCDDT